MSFCPKQLGGRCFGLWRDPGFRAEIAELLAQSLDISKVEQSLSTGRACGYAEQAALDKFLDGRMRD